MVRIKRVLTKRNGAAGSQQVSSSRRRPLSFDKATEVYAVCSLETALFLFSPGGKFYDPRVEALLRGFMLSKKTDPLGTKCYSDQDASLHELYRQYAVAVAEWKAIKRRGEELKKLTANREVRLFTLPVSELNLEEMIELKTMLENVKVNLLNRIEETSVKPSSSVESSSSNDVESIECCSYASGESECDDMDVNSDVHGKN